MSDLLRSALEDPRLANSMLDKLDAEASLLDFMRQGWPSIEPGQKLHVPWSLEVICEHLQAVTEGEIKRLLINVPPGFTKSMSTNVFWPMWEWGPRGLGHHRFISAAHEQGLSIRDNLRSRDLATSEWYQEQWADRWEFKEDQNAKTEYHNSLTGWRKASSTGSGLTGWRGDRLLLDDPHAVRDMESEAIREDALRWFSETLPTRLNNVTRSAIVCIMQRVHDRDISGLILKEELGYVHLCLPMEFEEKHRSFTQVPKQGVSAVSVQQLRRDGEPLPSWLTPEELESELLEKELAPEDSLGDPVMMYLQDERTTEGDLLDPFRFPRKETEELKRTFRAWGGTYAEAGQLQQRPAPRGGGMFQRDDFQMLDSAPEGVDWVRGYDLASSKDKRAAWTVGCKLGIDRQGRVIVADVDRRRATPGQVDEMMVGLAQRDGTKTTIDYPQDPGQAGDAQRVHILKLLHGYTARSTPESGSKEDRARPLAAQSEGGNLFLVRGAWNDAFINEACLFPNGEFLDQIDAASRAYARANKKRPARKPAGGMLIDRAGTGAEAGQPSSLLLH